MTKLTRRSLIGTTLGALPALAQLRTGGDLRISRIDPYLLRIGDRTTYPCVRIETSDGFYGWGEGTTPPSSPAVLAQIRECGKIVMDQSAWDREKLWRRMYIVEENTLGDQLPSRAADALEDVELDVEDNH